MPPLPHVTGFTELYAAGPSAKLFGSDLPLGQAIEVAFILGSFATRPGKLGHVNCFLWEKAEQATDAMEAGWQALSDWPMGFARMLDGLRAKADIRGGRFGLRREFGGVTKWISDLVHEPWATPIRDAFAAYLISMPQLRVTTGALRRFGSPEMLRNHHMTASDACDFLGVSVEKMAELAEREDLYLVRPSGAGAPSILRADLVHALRARRDETLLKGEAEKLLGVSRRVLSALQGAGLLNMLAAGKRVTQQRLLLRPEIEDMVGRATGMVRPAPPGTRLLSLLGTTVGGRTVTDVIAAVLDGRLVPRGMRTGSSGLGALMFDAAEVEAVLAVERETLTLVAAAECLGLDVESVRAWAAEGYLSTVESPLAQERGRRVTEEGIAAFRAEFITGAEIGNQASTTGRWAAERLLFHGHQTLSSESVTKLYRRSDITPKVIAALAGGCRVASRAESAASAFELARRTGAAVGTELGVELRRAWNGFADANADIYVQVIVGRRQRFRSKFVFRFNEAMRRRLDEVRAPWLALALADYDSYLLYPWNDIRETVGDTSENRHQMYFAVDAQGRVEDPDAAIRQRWLPSSLS